MERVAHITSFPAALTLDVDMRRQAGLKFKHFICKECQWWNKKEKERDTLGHGYTVSHVHTWLISEMTNFYFWHLPVFYSIK